jgi:hypothetical protein
LPAPPKFETLILDDEGGVAMQAVVVYESMYGNTHLVADAIGRGLGSCGSVTVVPVTEATTHVVATADLLVVGGPTHAHGMSRRGTRNSAVNATRRPTTTLALDPESQGPGVRDWLASLPPVRTKAAAFDTRFTGPAALTGRASRGITRGLRRRGLDVVAKPESFFVDHQNRLRDGEEARAVAWGEQLAAELMPGGFPTTRTDMAGL